MKDFAPGAQVYFRLAQKAPQALRGRRARVVAHWSGTAITLGRNRSTRDGDEDHGQRYWVAYKGSLLLVAVEHLRSATREEALADATLKRTPVVVQKLLSQTETVYDFKNCGDKRNQGPDMVPMSPLARHMAAETPAASERRRAGGRASAPNSPKAQPEPTQEDPDRLEESGAEGPTAEGSGAPAWAVPTPPDDESETLELRRPFKRGQIGKRS